MTRSRLVTVALVVVLVALVALPLLLGSGDFGGTDDAASHLVESSQPGYTPWFDNLFHPSGEVESGLFAMQAAIGGAVLGYVIGWYRGRKSR